MLRVIVSFLTYEGWFSYLWGFMSLTFKGLFFLRFEG